MSSFLDISQVEVPYSSVEAVYRHVRAAGAKELEGVALWAGTIHENNFKVETTIIPEQTAYELDEGLLYSVGEDELHRINNWLYHHKQTLIAQIHSHPGRAYHSDTDDRYPIVSQNGAISIVIPNFGFNTIAIKDWAIYRLYPKSGWVALSDDECQSLIQIINR